eukprot:4200389-Alexandrium_andersonii.AAC.1
MAATERFLGERSSSLAFMARAPLYASVERFGVGLPPPRSFRSQGSLGCRKRDRLDSANSERSSRALQRAPHGSF